MLLINHNNDMPSLLDSNSRPWDKTDRYQTGYLYFQPCTQQASGKHCDRDGIPIEDEDISWSWQSMEQLRLLRGRLSLYKPIPDELPFIVTTILDSAQVDNGL